MKASASAAVTSICFVFFLTCPSTELENLMSGTTGFISANSDLGLAGGPAQLAVRPEDNSTPLNKEIGTVEFASAKDSGLAGGRINLLNTEPDTHEVLGGEAVLYEVFGGEAVLYESFTLYGELKTRRLNSDINLQH